MTYWEWVSFISGAALSTVIGLALGLAAQGTGRPILVMCLGAVIGIVLGVASRRVGRWMTGWEWICRWCGWTNRGTDSSHFCEKCGTHR